MNKTKFIAVLIGVAVIAAGAALFFNYRKFHFRSFSTQQENQFGNQPEKKDTLVASGIKTEEFSGYKIYQNQVYKFSLEYPDKLGVVEFDEGEGAHTVLFQEQGGSGGFQIFISEFDEPGPVTIDRIKKDIPDIVIENLQEVGLPAGSPTSQSVPALIFFSRDESFGRTREVWFVHSGNLYQVTARADFDEELSKIMATLKFNYLSRLNLNIY